MKKVLAVLVNYGEDQLTYLKDVVTSLKQFKNYDVTVIVNSNVHIDIKGVDKINIHKLDDYQYLPLTCRRVIWENKENYDLFIYGENDHLFLEHHLDKHLEYSKILPQNRISGLIQYEENNQGRFYPGYHQGFEWDFKNIEIYNNKTFAYFSNVHQASFILTRNQLAHIGKKINFNELVKDSRFKRVIIKIISKLGIKTNSLRLYSVKCKVNTDIYQYAGLKKLICVSEFEDNLIHHLPNLYIKGEKGRLKLRSPEDRMNDALSKLLLKKGS